MKVKQLLFSIPFVLATTFFPRAVVADEVVDIQITRLSPTKVPIDYKDAEETQQAINSILEKIREASAAYFFQNVKGNFDKFQLYTTTEFPSARIMNLNLELQMEPGFVLKNGNNKLIRKFKINLLNVGSCFKLNDITRLWDAAPSFKTAIACQAQNEPAVGKYYTWEYLPLADSVNGACQELVPGSVGWSVTAETRWVGKVDCEKKMVKNHERFRWRSNLPELAADSDLRGYTSEIKGHLPQIPTDIRDVMRSFNVPKDYTLDVYPEERFQGTPITYPGPSDYSVTDLTHIKSIKLTKVTPPPPPPPPPAPVMYRVYFSGGYNGRAEISFIKPDGSGFKKTAGLGLGRNMTVMVPYGSRNLHFRAVTFTGLLWDKEQTIFDLRHSPVTKPFCIGAGGSTMNPNWAENPCSLYE